MSSGIGLGCVNLMGIVGSSFVYLRRAGLVEVQQREGVHWLEFLIPNLPFFLLTWVKILGWPVVLVIWVARGTPPSRWKAVTDLDGHPARRVVRLADTKSGRGFFDRDGDLAGRACANALETVALRVLAGDDAWEFDQSDPLEGLALRLEGVTNEEVGTATLFDELELAATHGGLVTLGIWFMISECGPATWRDDPRVQQWFITGLSTASQHSNVDQFVYRCDGLEEALVRRVQPNGGPLWRFVGRQPSDGEQEGLPGPGRVSLDEALCQALIGDSSADRRLVASGQTGIRRELREGERVNAIAVDQATGQPTLVVTNHRLMVMGRGGAGLHRSLEPEQIDQAAPSVSGMVRVMTDDGDDGDVVIRLRDYDAARALVGAVNDSLLSRRPRTIPTLFPTFFLNLLSAAGTPPTPTNMGRFVERVFVMITTQANGFFDQLDDPEARVAFARQFDGGGPEDRLLQSVDDAIDWLWAWNPACHRVLERTVARIHDLLIQPHSFLHTNGGDITPWSEWSTSQDRER